MQIVVSDNSCLIGLSKVSLLDTFLKLPYELLIPNTLFEEELLGFTNAQRIALVHNGLKVVDLPSDKVLRAQEVLRSIPQLSVHDGFAFALAESHPGCIMLSGDKNLRALADQHGIVVEGILWVFDEIYRIRLASAPTLLAALRSFADDPTVRLSRREISVHIDSYKCID